MCRMFALALLLLAAGTARANEISLFDSCGQAVAYIDVSDDMTIYIWEGKPVAYLDSSLNVYGFNGKHLGRFIDGVVRDHSGNAACAVRERMMQTSAEPFKGFKEFKPFKSFKEFARSDRSSPTPSAIFHVLFY